MKKSPFLHIILFGFLLGVTLVIGFGRPSPVDDITRVLVTQSDIAQLRAGWKRTWQREPTVAELQTLVDTFIHDEILYREALRMEYDRDDPLIRHTLKLKMEFLGESQALNSEPSLEEMQAYYSMRMDRYREPAKVSFIHVYFSTDKRGADAEKDSRKVVEQLISENPGPGELSGYGDRFMLKDHYVDQDEQQLRAAFGETFAQQVILLAPQVWHGPVASAYGLHLVKVYKRQEPYQPEIAEVEEKLRGDMDFENRQAAKQLFYTEILRNYQIEYDAPTREVMEGGGA